MRESRRSVESLARSRSEAAQSAATIHPAQGACRKTRPRSHGIASPSAHPVSGTSPPAHSPTSAVRRAGADFFEIRRG
jgi:hypothetical protein